MGVRRQGRETETADASAIIDRYAKNLTGKAKGPQYLGHARRWFAAAPLRLRNGGDPLPADVAGYVALRRRQRIKYSTIAGELSAVKRMYSLSGMVLPVGAVALKAQSEPGPALSSTSMLQLIAWAKRPTTPHLLRGYVAVSTVYGARASEIGAVRSEDVDLRGGRIYLWTRKGGDRRWQRIPPEVAWALQAPWRPLAAPQVCERFHVVCEGAGIPREKGDGWHTSRHAVAMALRDAGVSEQGRLAFLRWAAGGRRGESMADYYARSAVIIEPTGRRQRTVDDPDAEAWAAHPFTKAWRP